MLARLLIILPYIAAEQSIVIAEEIRKEVEKQSVLVEGKVVKVTISLGVASFHKYHELTKTIKKADQALYQAKKQGRNRIVIIEET